MTSEDKLSATIILMKKASGKALILFALALLSVSCVSKRLFVEEQYKNARFSENLQDCESQYTVLTDDYERLMNEKLNLEMQLANERSKLTMSEQQLDYFRNNNTNLLERLADLSVVSKTGAESIKQSLEALNEQSKYIKDLTTTIRQKDSLNLVLVMNLKRSLADINDEDITVEVRKGVVYISLSDKMLFRSGSAEVNSQAGTVLEKIARVLNDHSELEILVEGHTDNIPISNGCLVDNWDLSVKRATSVVRQLQTKYGISPERMTAGGRSEYLPKTANTTVDGRSVNRRTEIIITPKLDEFFELLEPGAGS